MFGVIGAAWRSSADSLANEPLVGSWRPFQIQTANLRNKRYGGPSFQLAFLVISKGARLSPNAAEGHPRRAARVDRQEACGQKPFRSQQAQLAASTLKIAKGHRASSTCHAVGGRHGHLPCLDDEHEGCCSRGKQESNLMN
jgi:hypothetical protein